MGNEPSSLQTERVVKYQNPLPHMNVKYQNPQIPYYTSSPPQTERVVRKIKKSHQNPSITADDYSIGCTHTIRRNQHQDKILITGYLRQIHITINIVQDMVNIIADFYAWCKVEHFRLSTRMIIRDFEIFKLTSRGHFGELWKIGLGKTKQIYTLKILRKKHLPITKHVLQKSIERNIIYNIDHPFVISLRYAFQTKSKLFMILDFCNGAQLFNETKFTEGRAKFYAAEMCLAIECLHNNNIIYGDLKPKNILLGIDGHVQITDFELSKESISADSLCVKHIICGSARYFAPEMLKKCRFDFMTDWWSFGTILYEMICGLSPFYDENMQKMCENILYGKIPFYSFMSRECVDLISKLLIKNAAKRITCNEMKDSDFFSDIDWDKCYNKEIEPPFEPIVVNKNDVKIQLPSPEDSIVPEFPNKPSDNKYKESLLFC
eukprot:458959_1